MNLSLDKPQERFFLNCQIWSDAMHFFEPKLISSHGPFRSEAYNQYNGAWYGHGHIQTKNTEEGFEIPLTWNAFQLSGIKTNYTKFTS